MPEHERAGQQATEEETQAAVHAAPSADSIRQGILEVSFDRLQDLLSCQVNNRDSSVMIKVIVIIVRPSTKNPQGSEMESTILMEYVTMMTLLHGPVVM